MKVEVGQVRMSRIGDEHAKECDVNEELAADGWFVVRLRCCGRDFGPLAMMYESQVLESYPQVVLPHGG